MQSYRTISRAPLKQTKRILLTPRQNLNSRKMSFFPRSFISHDPTTSFHPLFRLLDDFDQYSKSTTEKPQSGHTRSSIMKSFNPKFDVKEIGDVYELHGELPGIEQKDIEIEFSDAQTLTVKGHTERTYSAGTPPIGVLDSNAAPAAIAETADSNSITAHKASVEDEDKAQATSTTDNAVSETDTSEKDKEPEAKYWVSERSVGEFHRSFTFPVRVDQDQVRASMRNGILSVIVPKAKKLESRKIAIA